MIDFGVLLMLAICIGGITLLWIRHKYLEWQEDKKFWKEVDSMLDTKNKIFLESFEKLLEDMKPWISDIYKKK